jgi:hypothetical protein
LSDPWLACQCRKAFANKWPAVRKSGLIVAANLSCNAQRDNKNRLWLAVMTAVRGRRLRLNFGTLPDQLVLTSRIQISTDGRGKRTTLPDDQQCSGNE